MLIWASTELHNTFWVFYDLSFLSRKSKIILFIYQNWNFFYFNLQQISQHPRSPWCFSFRSEFHPPLFRLWMVRVNRPIHLLCIALARVIISKSANLSQNGQSKQHLSDTRGHKWLKWCDKWFASFSPGLPQWPENGNERSPVNDVCVCGVCVCVFRATWLCSVGSSETCNSSSAPSCSRVTHLE